MKYFIVSDMHSYTTLLKKTLNKKGFIAGDPNMKLIVCGDIFDRGEEPAEMLEFLKSLGDQLIFIRGNHEDLLEECLDQLETVTCISGHHRDNGTIGTVDRLLIDYYNKKHESYFNKYQQIYTTFWANMKSPEANKSKELEPVINLYKPAREVLNWIKEKSINYFETDHYIFTHGWIPSIINSDHASTANYYSYWRQAPEEHWKEARWLNGMLMWKQGVVEPNKTIVCGHWHCSFGNSHYHLEQHLKEWPQKNRANWQKSFKPFIDNGIIAIDAATAWSGLINCIIIED